VFKQAALLPSYTVVCIADDTVISSAGEDWGEARTNEALSSIVRYIRNLELKMAPENGSHLL